MNNLTLSNKITFKAALKWAFVVALAFGVFLPMRSDAMLERRRPGTVAAKEKLHVVRARNSSGQMATCLQIAA